MNSIEKNKLSIFIFLERNIDYTAIVDKIIPANKDCFIRIFFIGDKLKYKNILNSIKKEKQSFCNFSNDVGKVIRNSKYVLFLRNADFVIYDEIKKAIQRFDKNYEDFNILFLSKKTASEKIKIRNKIRRKLGGIKEINISISSTKIPIIMQGGIIKVEELNKEWLGKGWSFEEEYLQMTFLISQKTKIAICYDLYLWISVKKMPKFPLDFHFISKKLLELSSEQVNHNNLIKNRLFLIWNNSRTDESSHALRNKLLRIIPDKIITENSTSLGMMYEIFSLKYGEDIENEFQFSKSSSTFKFKGINISTQKLKILTCKIIEINDSILSIEGKYHITNFTNARVFVKSSIEEKEVIPISYKNFDKLNPAGNMAKKGYRFKISIKIADSEDIFFTFKTENNGSTILPLFFDSFIRPLYFNNYAYLKRHEYLIKGVSENTLSEKIRIKRNSFFRHFAYELKYLKFLIFKKHFIIIPAYRIIRHLMKIFHRKPICLIFDRTYMAGDNGEALYKYIVENNLLRKLNIYFAVSKKTKAYVRLKKIGKVLSTGSFDYKMKFLMADILISSTYLIYPFAKNNIYFSDLYTENWVFLRHGISHNDQSMLLNKLNK
ncbi:MAG: hypothetical protein LBD41_00180, partial [Clostridiales Family XIII bacterium]|nr:hypothetical protein [Clostridiales Family XIII bacterium]